MAQAENLEAKVDPGSEFMDSHILDRAAKARRCVACIRTKKNSGTGVLLPNNWLLTNKHVISDISVARNAIVQFSYERQADGTFTSTKDYFLDPETAEFSENDDWMVIKVKGNANDTFGAIRLKRVEEKNGIEVSIIQHPEAGPSKYSRGKLVRRSKQPPWRILYTATTLKGSSGAPVFNEQMEIVGLHFSSESFVDEASGELVEYNQGICMNAILDELESKDLWRHEGTFSGDWLSSQRQWIIERSVDRKVYASLKKGRTTVAIRGGRQMGKTLIAERVENQMEQLGCTIVRIDLAHEFGRDQFNCMTQFTKHFANLVLKQLSIRGAGLGTIILNDAPSDFPVFFDYIREAMPNIRLILRLSNIDAIHGTESCSLILSGLRLLHNHQQRGGDNWLQLLLVHTVSPRQQDVVGSIYDVSKECFVNDFTEDELRRIGRLYKLDNLDFSQLCSFLGGHPRLSQDVFEEISEGKTLSAIILDAKRNGGIFRQHLESLVRGVRRLPEARECSKAYKNLVDGKTLANEHVFDLLLGLGLIRGTYHGDAEVRCELYKYYLYERIG